MMKATVILIAVTASYAAAAAVEWTGMFKTNLAGLKPGNGGDIDTTPAKTLLRCAKRCTELNTCRSIFYVPLTLECQLHTLMHDITSPGLVAAPSAVYFEKKAETCIKPPFVCPTTTSANYTQYCDLPFSYRVYVGMLRNFADAKAHCIAEGGSLVDILTVYVGMLRNFADAKAHCIAEGGSLVDILTLPKMNFVRTLIQCPVYSLLDFWVDGEYNDVTGAYVTSDGVPLPLAQGTFFYTGKPKTFGPGRAIITASNMLHLLDDELDYRTNYMICEKMLPIQLL